MGSKDGSSLAGDGLIPEPTGPHRLLPLWEHPLGDVFAAGDGRRKRALLLTFLRPTIGAAAEAERHLADTVRALEAADCEFIYPIVTTRRIRDGRLVIAGDLLEGTTLAQHLLDGPLSATRTIPILRQTCRALHAAHTLGHAHGALSVASVILTAHDRDGREDSVRVTDFGLGEAVTPAAMGDHEVEMQPLSPDRLNGQPPSVRGDIYLLGAIGYAALAGKFVFEGTADEIRRHHQSDEPARLEGPAALVEVLKRCLAKRPEDRFASVHDVEVALRAAQRTHGLVTPWDEVLDGAPPAAASAPPTAPASPALDAKIPSGPFVVVGAGPKAAQTVLSEASGAVRRSDLDGALGPADATGPRAPEPRIPPPPTIGGAPTKRTRASALGLNLGRTKAKSDAADSDATAPGSKSAPAKPEPEATPERQVEPEPGPEPTAKPAPQAKPAPDAKPETTPEPEPEATVVERPSPASKSSDEATPRRPAWTWIAGVAALVLVGVWWQRGSDNDSNTVPPAAHRDAGRPPTASAAVAPTPAEAPAPAPEAIPTADAPPSPPTSPPAAADDDPIVIGEPEAAEPEAAAPDTAEPETAEPETDVAPPSVADDSPRARAAELVRLGNRAHSAGQVAAAASRYKQALAIDSRNHAAAAGLGKIHFNRGEYEHAASAYNKAVKAAPGRSAYRLAYGDALFKSAKFADARAQYAKAKAQGNAQAAGRLDKVDRKLGS